LDKEASHADYGRCTYDLGGHDGDDHAVTVAAQAYRPAVRMSVTLPNGQTQDLSAPESGLAAVTVNDREYGFRPTMMDDRGARIVITLLDMGGPTDAVKTLGEMETSGRRADRHLQDDAPV
jgi:hypothetical protein